jgi:hypothetical protein
MMNAFEWMDTQSYIQRAAWFGAFQKAPDSYATSKNALFNSKGELSDMGYWYVLSFLCTALFVSHHDDFPRFFRFAYTSYAEKREELDHDEEALKAHEFDEFPEVAREALEVAEKRQVANFRRSRHRHRRSPSPAPADQEVADR